MLAATCDSDIFKQIVIHNPKNSFFDILKYVHGLKNLQINYKVYQLRGICMLKYFQGKSSKHCSKSSNIITANCFTHVANLSSFILNEYPSITLHLKCSTHLDRRKILKNYLIDISDVVDTKLFFNIVEERIEIQFCKKCGSRAEISKLQMGWLITVILYCFISTIIKSALAYQKLFIFF